MTIHTVPIRVGLTAVVAGALILVGGAADATTTPTHQIGVRHNPYEIAMVQRTGEAYVVNRGSVSVIDLATRRPVATIPTGNGSQQVAIASGNAGHRVFVGAPDSPYMSVLSTKTHRVLDNNVLVGNGTVSIATSATKAGPRQFLAQLQSDRLAIVDAQHDEVDYLGLPHGPQVVVTQPKHNLVWAGSSYSGRIWLIGTNGHKVRRTITVARGGPVMDIAFTRDGRTAWVTGMGGLSVVNSRTGAVIRFMSAPTLFPRARSLNMGPVVLNGRATRAYVVNSTYPDEPGRGAVRVVNTRTHAPGKRVPTGIEPLDIRIDRGRGIVYVANYGSGDVTTFSTR